MSDSDFSALVDAFVKEIQSFTEEVKQANQDFINHIDQLIEQMNQ